MSSPKIDLIRQALSASESSIRLARQLLTELEKDHPGQKSNKQQNREQPGVAGIFDGQNMITESGDKHSVPENYASKSILVVGDTLKLVEGGGEKRFKQIEHVKRHKTTGILTKKDGKWASVTPEGSYRLLSAAVAHFGGDVGDEVLLQLPANNLQVTWAALEKVTKEASGEKVEEPKPYKEEEVKSEPASQGEKKPASANQGGEKKEPKKETKEEKSEKPKAKAEQEASKIKESEEQEPEPKKEVEAKTKESLEEERWQLRR
jgi:hypothetical protein